MGPRTLPDSGADSPRAARGTCESARAALSCDATKLKSFRHCGSTERSVYDHKLFGLRGCPLENRGSRSTEAQGGPGVRGTGTGAIGRPALTRLTKQARF